MKTLGVIFAIIGGFLMIISLNIDTSVEVPGDGAYGLPRRVNNIGLMDQRRNYLIVSSLLILCGAMFIVFGNGKGTSTDVTPNDEKTSRAPEPTFGEGERILDNDAYKIYLVKRYEIEFNETLKNYLFNDALFPTLDHALAAARAVDLEKINKAEIEAALRREWELAKTSPPPHADAVCPNGNCSAQLRHTDQSCWKCNAEFTHPQGWKPIQNS